MAQSSLHEVVFRSLKSELGLRPIHHRVPRRTEEHLFLSVIAFQFVQLIRSWLRRCGNRASWATLRRALRAQRRTTATFRCADGRPLHVRKTSKPKPAQREIYDALGVDPRSGGVRNTQV